MKRTKYLPFSAVLATFLTVTALAFGQPINLPCRTYGDQNSERALALVPGANSGYVLAGWTTSYVQYPGDTNLLIVRTDSTALPLIRALYSNGSSPEVATSMVRTTDGGYAVTGWTRSYGPGTPLFANLFVIKLDSVLRPQWNMVYGSVAGDEEAYSIIQTSDGGYAVCGRTSGLGPTPRPNVLFLKLAPNGTVMWCRVYNRVPHIGAEEAYGITEITGSPLDRYALVGRVQRAVSPPNFDAFVMWVDSLGTIRGISVVPGDVEEEGYSILWDGANLVAAGWSNSYGSGGNPEADIWVWKLPAGANQGWRRMYGWPGHDEKLMGDRALIRTTDGGYGVAGWTFAKGPGVPSNPNMLILKLTTNGDIQWSRVHPSMPGANAEQAYSMVQTPRGYGIAGFTNSFGMGGSDFHFVTLDTNGNRPRCVIDTVPPVDTFPSMRDSMVMTIEYLDTASLRLSDTTVRTVEVCSLPYKNVGVRLILGPAGTIDSLMSNTPACSVYNYGNTTETYDVRMKVGSFYNQPATVTGHTPGTSQYVAFPAYADWPRGTHIVSCSTELTGDMFTPNDSMTDTVHVRVKDVGCPALLAPAGGVDSGTVVTPACSVFNYGTDSQTYAVRMKVGAGYNQPVTVAGHSPGAMLYVTFPSWTAVTVGGPYAVTCSTEAGGDVQNANDVSTGWVAIRRPGGRDVGCVRITAPSGTMDSGFAVVPACSTYNYGTQNEDYTVRMRIGPGYDQTATVTAHVPGVMLYVTFPNWDASPVGNLVVSCSTEMSGDDTPADDKRTGSVLVRRNGPDVGCTRVLAPSGTLMLGQLVTPSCSVYNYGNATATYPVRVRIGSVFDTTAQVTSHVPGAWRRIVLPAWAAGPADTHDVLIFTELLGDVTPGNDTARGSCIVTTTGHGGWVEKAPMLPEPSGRPVRDGAWLAYNAGNDRIYAAKGNKTGDFYTYNPATNVWYQLQMLPTGAENRYPFKGAVGCADGNNTVYATKGNNSVGFWRYDINGDSWQQLPNVPLGIFGKKVKGGTDMVFVDRNGERHVYLLKGYRNEFYRYNLQLDSWQTLEPAPTTRNGRYNDGSFIAYDGDRSIYAHKARYHELWRYDLESQAWDTAHRLGGMPIVNGRGQAKKSKDGGCGAWYAGSVFAFKGANTQEFWRYFTDADSWAELETIPAYGSSMKVVRVRGGADLTSRDNGQIYALKGARSREFWCYTIQADLFAGAPRRDGVAAAPTLNGRQPSFTISPNPLRPGFAILRLPQLVSRNSALGLSIFDPSGRLVLNSSLVTRNSSLALDLRGLSAGVYLVRLSANGVTATQKLVIQR